MPTLPLPDSYRPRPQRCFTYCCRRDKTAVRCTCPFAATTGAHCTCPSVSAVSSLSPAHAHSLKTQSRTQHTDVRTPDARHAWQVCRHTARSACQRARLCVPRLSDMTRTSRGAHSTKWRSTCGETAARAPCSITCLVQARQCDNAPLRFEQNFVASERRTDSTTDGQTNCFCSSVLRKSDGPNGYATLRLSDPGRGSLAARSHAAAAVTQPRLRACSFTAFPSILGVAASPLSWKLLI
eukprot:208276-Pleurochrysis_carterae.AAC.10